MRLTTWLFSRFPALVDRWLARHPVEASRDVPWTPFTGDLRAARVGLVSTAGVHGAEQAPFDMSDPDGDAGWRRIPADTPADRITITHDYYDTRAARRDLNVVFPVERLQELAAAGRIAAVAEQNVGMMGHIDGRQLPRLIEESAPSVARHFRAQGVDLVLLVPT